MTQPVIEKIPLPLDAKCPGNVFLPFTHNLRHRFIYWKRDQGMQMIRHQKQELHPPITTLMEDPNRLENVCCQLRYGKLILATRFTANGDEEHGFLGTNLIWYYMFELFSLRVSHGG